MAKVVVDMTGDAGKLVRALTRSEQEVDKLKGKLREIGQAGKKAGEQTEGAFGGKALGSLKTYVSGLLGIAAAVGTVRKALMDIRQMSQEAGARITDDISGRRALAQIATTRKEYLSLIATAERIRQQPGMPAGEAYGVTFAAGSAGPRFLQNIDMYAQLREIAFAPQAAIQSAQKLQAAFGGTGAGAAGAGTGRAVVNKILAAAGPSPVMAQEIAEAAAIAAPSFAGIGGGDEELLATLAVMAEPFKTPEAAAQRIKSVSDQLLKKRRFITDPRAATMSGLDLIRALPGFAAEGKLRTEGGKKVDLTEFLAESNALQFMEIFGKQEKDIASRLDDVKRAEMETGSGDLLARRFAIVAGDPTSVAVSKAERAEQRRLLQEENLFAVPEKLADAAIDQAIVGMRRRGASELAVWARRAAEGITRLGTTSQQYYNLVQGSRRGREAEYLAKMGVMAGSTEDIEQFSERAGVLPFDDPRLLRELTPLQKKMVVSDLWHHGMDERAAKLLASFEQIAVALGGAADKLGQATGGGTALAKPDEDR